MKTTTTPSGTGRARLGLIVSMTVFGTIGLFVRRIEITSAELALCRAGLAAVFLLLYFLVTRRRLCLSEIKKSLWLLLASGAAMGINWMLLFEAYKYTTISLATLSYYLAPVIVTALCPLLFHERMTRTQLLCFLMSTLGVALIIGSGGVQGGGSASARRCFTRLSSCSTSISPVFRRSSARSCSFSRPFWCSRRMSRSHRAFTRA